MKFGKFYVDFTTVKNMDKGYKAVNGIENNSTDMITCTITKPNKKYDGIDNVAYGNSYRMAGDKPDRFKGLRLAFERAMKEYQFCYKFPRKTRKKLWYRFYKEFGHLELITITRGQWNEGMKE